MEKTMRMRKIKNSLYLIIVGLILLAGIALAIYYMISGDRDKRPERGTYVLNICAGKEHGQ